MARRTPKNGPCPCGSGKRYKSCCMKADAEQRAARRQDVRAIEAERTLHHLVRARRNELLPQILRWALDDEQRETLGATPFPPIDDPDAMALIGEWAAFDCGRAARYIAQHPVPPKTRLLLEAFIAGLTGLWEVLEVFPGQGMRLRERFSGAERTALEPEVSGDVKPGRWLIGRVSTYEGVSFLTAYPHLFTAAGAEACGRGLAELIRPGQDPDTMAPLSEDELRDPKVIYATLGIAGMVGQGVENARAEQAIALDALTRPVSVDLA
ncbi:MAG: SEC-C domain-containing protein [Alphaproteobacteria bacterium]|nr:SEC-C domain-containing protein [Alphaproteobacteria bacterium]